jgi:RND superfamily putative drug exporter
VFLKVFGIGLATSIFVDATIVRMILVPAVMQLLGARNWWIPGWLEKILPDLEMEKAPPARAEA